MVSPEPGTREGPLGRYLDLNRPGEARGQFVTLGWFTAQLGDEVLLQPNRYEVGPLGLMRKAYTGA